MREPFTQLYLHLVWATWDRLPLITPDIEARLYGAFVEKCRELKCLFIRGGGMDDHVHLLVRLHTTVAVATLVKEIKGSSSHLMNHAIRPNEMFKWQGAYGAFTLAKAEAPIVKDYIMRQKEHHKANTLIAGWERSEIRDEEELKLLEADMAD
jgi:REP element-mobilizing transposase RayT